MGPRIALQAAYAFIRIVRNPNRLDVIFKLVDSVLADKSAQVALEANLCKPGVRDAALQRVRLPALRLEALEVMPAGSFGETAARFFRANDLDPDALPRREVADDSQWLSAHLYETHDLWHVLTGFGPAIEEELGLQAFYAAQVEGVVALSILSAGLLNSVMFAPAEGRRRMEAIIRGWQMGVRASTVIGVDWGALLQEPLADVRARFGIAVPAEHDAMAQLARSPQRGEAA